MEHVDVAGVRIGFQVRGQGPVVVLLHGAMCDGRVWRGELERLADAFTVIAWDTPGCGTSPDARDDFRMVDYADALAGFIAALDVGRPHVLGHSWGSTLALELCRRHPSVVRSLVLVGAYAGWAGSLLPSEVHERLEFALRAADMGPAAFDPTSMVGLFSDLMPPDEARALATAMSDARPAATRTMAYALAECDLRDVLPGIDVPTLLVCGDADARSPLSVAAELQRSIPGSTMVVLPGLGHECYLESPDTFSAVVRAFLVAQV